MAPRIPAPKIDPRRCAPSARRRSDPLMATAAPATRWLLVEQPGAWGRQALQQSDLAPTVASSLLVAGVEAGVRIQAIRRPPERGTQHPRRRWAYVDSGTHTPPTAWWGEFTEDAELLELALDGSQGSPSTDPIFLVCTHAKHDACCALFGRPTYTVVSSQYPGHTWETSHVGGDRFAASMVILPLGLYYGGLDGDSAIQVVASHLDGRIEPAFYRGASVHPVPTQAAEHYLRAHLGDFRIGSLDALALQQVDLTRWIVRMTHVDGSAFDVQVSATHAPSLNRLTCGASHPAAARLFELNSLREVDQD